MTTQLKFLVELKNGKTHTQYVDTHPDAVSFLTAKLVRHITREEDV